MIASAIYILCAITSGICALLLTRMYRRSGDRLLLWSSLSFAAWTLANALVFVDLVLVPSADLQIFRSATGLAAIGLLLFGLVWESE
jgi:hypothetical protein